MGCVCAWLGGYEVAAQPQFQLPWPAGAHRKGQLPETMPPGVIYLSS